MDSIKKRVNIDLLSQFIRFCIVGVFGASLNYSIFFVLYRFFSFHYIVSSATGFILSVFLAFFLNKKFTFRSDKDRKTGKMILKYFLVNLFSILIGMVSLKVFVETFLINVYLANLIVIGITTSLNFMGSKLFAFR